MDYFRESLALHKRLRGKLSVVPKIRIKNAHGLSLVYTPGVVGASREIFRNPRAAFDLTIKGNSVGVVTDGSSVLAQGNIGALASLPVMEGKCILFKQLVGIDAFPIALDTHDPQKIVGIVKNISPVFGGINLEDISAPRCFEIEQKLRGIGVPVFHDDQHGTAIVVLAALINACRVSGKDFTGLKVVISGAGAAGTAIARLLSCCMLPRKLCIPVKEIIVVDSKGIISKKRKNLPLHKKQLLHYTNPGNISGKLPDALAEADVFVGVSTGNVLKPEWIRHMAEKPIIFALSNPIPEIMPEKAKRAGAFIVGTGRSDFPNQINNALAFPGIFRGALDARAAVINDLMKLVAATAISVFIKKPSRARILPRLLDKKLHSAVAKAVKKAAISTNA